MQECGYRNFNNDTCAYQFSRRAIENSARPAGQGGRRGRKVNEKMAKDKYYGKTLRKNFARHEEVMPMPNLLEIQKKSYQ